MVDREFFSFIVKKLPKMSLLAWDLFILLKITAHLSRLYLLLSGLRDELPMYIQSMESSVWICLDIRGRGDGLEWFWVRFGVGIGES